MTPSETSLRLHQFQGLEPGPRFIVLGAVHGNETSGSQGIARIAAELDAGALELVRGTLTLLPVTNPRAYRLRQRQGDRNLNRNLRPDATPRDYEDRIARVLCPVLAAHDVLLDLHSFQSVGQPFAMIGPPDNDGSLQPFARAAEEQALVLRLGVRRIVEGWLDVYARGVQERLARTPVADRAGLLSTDPEYGVGTTEYMRRRGGYAVTLECGQHEDPAAPETAYRAIRAALAHLGMVEQAAPAPCAEPEFLRLVEVVDRLHAQDRFERPWASYDPLHTGQRVATRHDGTPVLSPLDGYIVFPNERAQPGNEWFYLARSSPRRLTA